MGATRLHIRLYVSAPECNYWAGHPADNHGLVPKAFSRHADRISVNVYRNNSMNYATRSVALLGILSLMAIAQVAPKKITRSEALSAVVTRVQPDYPPMARQLKMQGTVELTIEVGETGEVVKVDIVSGNPVLTQSAASHLYPVGGIAP